MSSEASDNSIPKPMNSFFYYRKAMRSKIIELYKTSKSHEISKIAGSGPLMINNRKLLATRTKRGQGPFFKYIQICPRRAQNEVPRLQLATVERKVQSW